MRRFERMPDGTLEALLDAEEALLLQSLAGQIADLIADGVNPEAADGSDPALARLLPDAYPDDAEASSEFRRFTERGLADRKLQNAQRFIRSLDDSATTGRVSLDDAESQAWLRCLTDIRLTIAARLGIDTEDDDAGRSIDPLMREIYDWLGFVQNSVIEAIDGHADHG